MIFLYLLLGFFVVYAVLINMTPDPWWWDLARDNVGKEARQVIEAHKEEIVAALRRGESYDITFRGETYTIKVQQ